MKIKIGHSPENIERNLGICPLQTGFLVRKNCCLKNLNKQMNDLAKHIV